MLRWIVGSSLKYRFIVLAIAAALTLVGLDQMRHMPVDVFPEFAPPIVEIQTPCLGLAPTEVEALVTVPLEQALAGLPHLAFLPRLVQGCALGLHHRSPPSGGLVDAAPGNRAVFPMGREDPWLCVTVSRRLCPVSDRISRPPTWLP